MEEGERNGNYTVRVSDVSPYGLLLDVDVTRGRDVNRNQNVGFFFSLELSDYSVQREIGTQYTCCLERESV